MSKRILFLAGILLVGILTLLPYGFYLDQDLEQQVLYSNIKEYLLHLPGDGSEAQQELMDSTVPEISVSADKYRGMAVYYPAFLVWYINKLSPYWGSVFWHLYTFLLVFWGMCSLFFLGKNLFHKERVAAFLVLLFFLTPRMFAESHYNNKDMVLLSLTFTLFYWGKRLMEKPSLKNICLFSIIGALAANMRIIGAWLFGALGLYPKKIPACHDMSDHSCRNPAFNLTWMHLGSSGFREEKRPMSGRYRLRAGNDLYRGSAPCICRPGGNTAL